MAPPLPAAQPLGGVAHPKMQWLLLALLLNLLLPMVAGGKKASKKWAPLMCSACETFSKELSLQIEKGKGDKSSILNSHRLGKDNQNQRVAYATSELRAIEILDELCSSVAKYKWRQSKVNHTRMFTTSKSDTKKVDYYDKNEEELFEGADSQLDWHCNKWVDDHHDRLVESIQNSEGYDSLVENLCKSTLKLCQPKKMKAAAEKELTRRAAWKHKEEARKNNEETKKKLAKEEGELKDLVKKGEESSRQTTLYLASAILGLVTIFLLCAN